MGFGTPLVIVAPILLALGVKPAYAVIIPLIGHAWANFFGTLGVGWLATTQVVSLDDDTLTAVLTAALLVPVIFCIGVGIAWMIGRWQAVRHGMPFILIQTGVLGGVQLVVVLFSPELSTFLAGSAAMLVVLLLTKWSRYSEPFDLDEAPALEDEEHEDEDTRKPVMNLWMALAQAEATKLAFADRDAWLTDPRHHDIPVETLLDDDYARERAGLIRPDSARDMAKASSGVDGGWEGERTAPSGDTCYLCAVDDDGLAVSLIQSIYHDFGSGIVARDTGILLQNRGSFFSTDPDHHNSLEPGKRTFHTLIPALMLDARGGFECALGSMGGEGQPQTQAAMVVRMVDFGYNIQQAIEAPRWLMGRTWGAESQDLWLEARIPETVIQELEALGQPVKMLPRWDDNVGHAQAIRRTPEGFLEGGADPRGDGAAIGF